MAKKAVLGRGLDALLPSTPQHGTTKVDVPTQRRFQDIEDRSRHVGRVAEIEIERISPNPYQPRETFSETALSELTASIKQLGIIQPLTVRVAADGRYELITGERRLRAAKRAGLATVPAYIREADTEAMLEMALVENVQREELDPIEVAMRYRRLIDECLLTQEDVALKVGKNRTTVANLLRLLRLPPEVQAKLRERLINAGHARALLALERPEEQIAMAQAIAKEGLSVRQVEDRTRTIVRKRTKEQAPTPSNVRALHARSSSRDALQLQAFTDLLRARFGTQIQIHHQPQNGSGRIDIAYYSPDDLERLMELLLNK